VYVSVVTFSNRNYYSNGNDKQIYTAALSIKRHNFCVTKITYIMYNVQDYSVHQNNAVRQVICEG